MWIAHVTQTSRICHSSPCTARDILAFSYKSFPLFFCPSKRDVWIEVVNPSCSMYGLRTLLLAGSWSCPECYSHFLKQCCCTPWAAGCKCQFSQPASRRAVTSVFDRKPILHGRTSYRNKKTVFSFVLDRSKTCVFSVRAEFQILKRSFHSVP